MVQLQEVERLQNTGDLAEQLPKFYWDTLYPGQANYIVRRCNEEGLRVDCLGHRVLIYSKKKIPIMMNVITESMQWVDRPEPELCQESLVLCHGRKTLAVMLKKNETCYVPECHFSELQYYIFMRKAPHLKNYVIFNSVHEMIDHLREKLNLAI